MNEERTNDVCYGSSDCYKYWDIIGILIFGEFFFSVWITNMQCTRKTSILFLFPLQLLHVLSNSKPIVSYCVWYAKRTRSRCVLRRQIECDDVTDCTTNEQKATAAERRVYLQTLARILLITYVQYFSVIVLSHEVLIHFFCCNIANQTPIFAI